MLPCSVLLLVLGVLGGTHAHNTKVRRIRRLPHPRGRGPLVM